MGQMLGKVAVVTGARSGLGRAVAMTRAAEGATAPVADTTEDVLEGGVPTA